MTLLATAATSRRKTRRRRGRFTDGVSSGGGEMQRRQ
jgi:hypothetical protein